MCKCQIAGAGYTDPEMIPGNFIMFNENLFAVLFLELNSLSLYVRVKELWMIYSVIIFNNLIYNLFIFALYSFYVKYNVKYSDKLFQRRNEAILLFNCLMPSLQTINNVG